MAKRLEQLEVTPRICIPTSEFEWSFARSSGPGGQNVQKVNSKAVLRWMVVDSPTLPADVRQRFVTHYASRLTTEGALVLASDRFRDQGRNIDDCLDRLRTMLLGVAVAPKVRKKSRPSRGSIERRLEQKRRTSDKKTDRRKSGE